MDLDVDVVVFVDVDVGMDVDGHTAAVFDADVFVHACADEEVVGGRRGEWDVDVSGENGDGKEQRR